MADLNEVSVRFLTEGDREFVTEIVARHFGSSRVVSRGRLHQCEDLPGLVAEVDGGKIGLVQFEVRAPDLEVVTLASELPGVGVGRRLLNRVVDHAGSLGNLKRCWLVTTNNNHNAINFYRHIGWQHRITHRGAVRRARTIKPEIPLTDGRGIPIEDELEFELLL